MTNERQHRKSGWKQWSAEEAREALRAWRDSGMSLNAFARRAGLSARRLSWWRKRLGEWAPASNGASELRLVPVVTSVPGVVSATPALTTMRLPGGVVVEFDATQVSARWVAEVALEVARAE
jgi:transposase-like protein